MISTQNPCQEDHSAAIWEVLIVLRGKMALQAADLNLGDINLVLETHHVLTASFSLPQLFFFSQFYSYIYCFYTLFEAAWAFFSLKHETRHVVNSLALPGELLQMTSSYEFLQLGR